MRHIKIYQHSRGNHSIRQIVEHGKPMFNYRRGTYLFSAKEAREELKQMRRFCKNHWYEYCGELSYREFIADSMSDIFAVDIDTMQWF